MTVDIDLGVTHPCASISLSTVVLSIQVNEKSFDLKEGI